VTAKVSVVKNVGHDFYLFVASDSRMSPCPAFQSTCICVCRNSHSCLVGVGPITFGCAGCNELGLAVPVHCARPLTVDPCSVDPCITYLDNFSNCWYGLTVATGSIFLRSWLHTTGWLHPIISGQWTWALACCTRVASSWSWC